MFICLDTETTGISKEDQVLQVAAVEINPETFGVKDTFSALVNPQVKINPEASKVHGYYDKDVENEPTLEELLKTTKLGDWFSQATIIMGHNVKFDIRMLGSNLTAKYNILDTLTISRYLFPQFPNHKLTTVVKQLDLPSRKAHDALGDVMSCVDFIQHLKVESKYDLPQLLNLSLNGKSLFAQDLRNKLKRR